MLTLENIYKSYRTTTSNIPVLNGVSVEFSAGEFCAITGTSGSGKSTLLNILGLLEKPDSGSYSYNAVSVDALSENDLATVRNRHFGFIFQAFHLIPRLTALDNVSLPLAYHGVIKEERQERARQGLEKVGLLDRLLHRPGELSGGQKQIVAIARAMIANPQIIFDDEPTGNLDDTTSKEIITLLRGLNDRMGVTVIIVTHDSEMTASCGRHVQLRDGRIVDDRRNMTQQHLPDPAHRDQTVLATSA